MKKVSPSVAKRKLFNALPNFLPFIVTFGHVLLSPYTKVEESFTLHAVHDVLAYGWDRTSLQYWDHITFPGAVPRSFLPPIILGILSYPVSCVGVAVGLVRTKIDVQIAVRLILAAMFSHSFNHLSKTLRARFGPTVRIWFTILSLTSFHIPYYAGRTLPNFMALPGVLLSISFILRSGSKSAPPSITTKRLRTAVILLTALATVVRLELALFLIPTAISLVIERKATLTQVVGWGMLGGFGSLALSSPIDYTLWIPTIPHPSLPTFTSPWQVLWPELSALHYNLLQGQSANWGVMPWHYYLTNSLPKILMISLPLGGAAGVIWVLRMVGIKVGGKEGAKISEGVGEILKVFGGGVVCLIGAMSLVGHKEWRFIIYSVPILQLISSFGAAGLWNFHYSRLRPLVRLGLVGLVVLNMVATGGLAFVSTNNYPGGEVWKALEKLPRGQNETIKIHFPSYPLQTGSTLFTFLHQHFPINATSHIGSFGYSPFPEQKEPIWAYSKSEDESYSTPEGLWDNGIDYVITEDWDRFVDLDGRWGIVDKIQGLDGVGRKGKYGLEVRWGKKLVMLARGHKERS
ncbi:hypothetical protein I302_104306 [Kwoniella bestiolae CBS 10118]|uniref:Mannosyltransferase n=1 Tax=Kwoniella bestiolae CBS 10118 TaxID=1296100 RepID=A0A1B9GAW3_9TREE|nr:hypothetical protein I302_03013 [Kwoniella bestiolae CBS 10118]OCF28162.1 hypothetical protein I302_03013 [Kwoniella bestiolae CBS 10118]